MTSSVSFSPHSFHRYALGLSLLVIGNFCHLLADTGTGPNLLVGDFESGIASYNPWAGVDDQGNIHVSTGLQLVVGDTGKVAPQALSPSVTVADLNGDGLPDLAVADPRGYFWYFPNSGKLDAPAFTHGEIMPIWLGSDYREGDVIPYLQLVDLTNDRKLSIIAGNYLGGLYYIANRGSTTSPAFQMQDRADVEVATHTDKLLWCNYLAPFLYDWSGTGRLDLMMGDGSYSANSIFLFKNMGTNEQPIFNEKNQTKIIPGMGREHLVPQVVDWNNDGKPDILAAERAGYINVYLNQAADKTAPPTFDPDQPVHVMFGTTDNVGPLPTVCAADLNHDKLFDLIIGNSDGTISYALNTGTPGSPKFGPLQPLKGVNPYPKIIKPRSWVLDRFRPEGAAYGLLECTNATLEQGFTPPPEPFKGKGAMKFSVVQPNNVYFKDLYKPADPTRAILYSGIVNLDAETRYILTMWVRTDGNISDLTWRMAGPQGIDAHNGAPEIYNGDSLGGSSSWSQITTDIRIPKVLQSSDNPDRKKETGSFKFWLLFQGDGTLYLDDISLRKAE